MDPVDVSRQRVTTNDPGGIAGGPGSAPSGAAGPGTTVATTTTGVYQAGFRATQGVWLFLGIVDVIIALDFVFSALGAKSTGFADLIYNLGRALAAPFEGIFANSTARGVSVLRWADVLAVIIYSLLALAVTKLVRIISSSRDSA